MARASFGFSQDNSALFAQLFDQYGDRLEDLTERAARRADEEQAAADNDFINRWQNGEVTDEEMLAYAQQRVDGTADDPEQNAEWKKFLRETEKQIQSEQISDTAEDIIDGINAGTRTYADLLKFYQDQQKKFRPSDPIYDELKKQIEQVQDQIAENGIAGAISGIDYNFRAGSITGSQAGAQLRAEAERYRVNDPQKYYQLLGQALEYEQYGGYFSAGSGGGSGGGGGGSNSSLNGTIDALQGIRDRLLSLSEQFEDGATVGSLTYEDESGNLVTEQLALMNPDGTPSRDMEAIDDEILGVYDELEQAQLEKGDRSAAGATANAKMSFITDHIQPRNTIGPEKQVQAMLGGFVSAVENAANSSDPMLAWRKVGQAQQEIARWHHYLNRRTEIQTTKTVSDEQARENPELRAAYRKEVQSAADLEDQTTLEFQQQADALLQLSSVVHTAKDVSAMEGVGDLLGIIKSGNAATGAVSAVLGASGVQAIVDRLSASVDLVTGIPQGKYAKAYIPGEGIVYTPMAETITTVQTPQGPQAVPSRVPIGPDGDPIFDESRGEKLETLAFENNGKIETIFGVSAPVYFIGNQAVSQSEFESFQNELKTTADEADLAELQALGEPKSYRQVAAPRADGKPGTVAWYQDQAGLWYKRKVTKGGGVPFIFAGKDARQAQTIANQINPATGQAYDPTGRAFFNERDYQQKRSHNVLEGAGDDWYDVSLRGKREEQKQADRQKLAESFSGRSFGGSFGGGKIGDIIGKQAQSLGINLGAPRAKSAFGPQNQSGQGATLGNMSRSSHGMRQRPSIGATLPKIAQPKLNLPTVRPSVLRGVDRPNVRVDAAGIRSRLAGVFAGRRPIRSASDRQTELSNLKNRFGGSI